MTAWNENHPMPLGDDSTDCAEELQATSWLTTCSVLLLALAGLVAAWWGVVELLLWAAADPNG